LILDLQNLENVKEQNIFINFNPTNKEVKSPLKRRLAETPNIVTVAQNSSLPFVLSHQSFVYLRSS